MTDDASKPSDQAVMPNCNHGFLSIIGSYQRSRFDSGGFPEMGQTVIAIARRARFFAKKKRPVRERAPTVFIL